MVNLSTEEKIKLLALALKATDLYDNRVYKLHYYCFELMNEIRCSQVNCDDKQESIKKLEDLIDGFKVMIYKFENYREVINQVEFKYD